MREAQRIIDTLLSSEIRGERLISFHRNLGLVVTVDGVARRIGRTGLPIENDVRDLVDLGALKMKRIGTSEILLLDRSRDREVLEAVANHIKTNTGEEN